MGVSDGGHAETCSHCHGDVILMGVMFVLAVVADYFAL